MRILFSYLALFSAAANGAPVTASERTSLIDNIGAKLTTSYVFPEKVPQIMSALRKRARAGAYTGEPDAVAKALTADLRRIAGDAHLGVEHREEKVSALASPSTPGPEQQARRAAYAKASNYGFDKVEILGDGIGYLHISSFLEPAGAAGVVHGAFRFLATSKALIIDLRGNQGGRPETVAIVASHLLPPGTHINSIYQRDGDRTQQFWTSGVDSSVHFDGPVYVLTDGETISAGEELAYDLQTQKRATIVGEVTVGGANPGGMVPIGDHYLLFVPGGRAINPVTKTNWEGVGVKPDVPTPAAQALDKAVALAKQAIGSND